MATTKSLQFAKQEAGSFRDRIDDKRQIEGEYDSALVEVVLDGTETTSTFISLLRLPCNAILMPERCRVIAQDPGTALAGTIGDALDADRYSGTVTLDAGGTVPFIAANAVAFPAGFTTRHKVTEETKDVVFDITAANTLTAGARLWFELVYKCL